MELAGNRQTDIIRVGGDRPRPFEPAPNCPIPLQCEGNGSCRGKCQEQIAGYALQLCGVGVEPVE